MSCNTKVNRLPRFKRLYPNVYSYHAELLYGKRFQQKLRTSKTFNQVKSTFEEVNPDYVCEHRVTETRNGLIR